MRGRARSESDRYMREIERRDAIDFARARTSSYPTDRRRVSPASVATCVECDRVFDLLDEIDAAEWIFGHDCEAAS